MEGTTMRNKLIAIFAIFGVALAGFFAGGLFNSENQSATESTISSPAPAESTAEVTPEPVEPSAAVEIPQFDVPSDEQAALAWSALMDEEGEYAAYAMYSAVIDKYGSVEPYVTIREAEGRHIQALIRQLSRFGIEVPENPYLGNVLAPDDLKTAAEAWAVGEIANVELYDELLAQTTDSNLIRVFNNLRASSNDQHLPLFTAAAENDGVLSSTQMQEFRGY